jgi:ribosomal protein S18 acetylase RimI-like enzyme
MDIRIRRATAADAGVVADLIGEMARAFGGTREMDASYVPIYLAHPGNGILLAEAAGEPVGLLAYSLRPNLYHGGGAGTVEELVVRAGMRRRGVGTALLRHGLDLLEEAGCVEVSLSTDLGNETAQALYRRLGLTEESLELAKHRQARTDTAFCRPSTAAPIEE